MSRSAPHARVSGPARQGRDRRGRARRTGVRGGGSGRDGQSDAAAVRIDSISSGGGRQAGTGGAARQGTPDSNLNDREDAADIAIGPHRTSAPGAEDDRRQAEADLSKPRCDNTRSLMRTGCMRRNRPTCHAAPSRI